MLVGKKFAVRLAALRKFFGLRYCLKQPNTFWPAGTLSEAPQKELATPVSAIQTTVLAEFAEVHFGIQHIHPTCGRLEREHKRSLQGCSECCGEWQEHDGSEGAGIFGIWKDLEIRSRKLLANIQLTIYIIFF